MCTKDPTPTKPGAPRSRVAAIITAAVLAIIGAITGVDFGS